ncbi:MAG: hypothetical protein J6U04_12850 [Salinivirgaceae bacterium]|nr:hypothetical protein [Salinivirgaceae bacterium]
MNIPKIELPHITANDIKPRHIKLSLVDLLMVLLFGMFWMSYLRHPSAVANVEFYKIATIAFVYPIGRIVITQSPKHIEWLLLLITAGWCCCEAVLGLMQIFGSRTSNHFLFACTGTFFNPGPFGGFLAVCLSLLAATFTVTKSKIWYYVAGATIFVLVIILPSTMSRSGLLGLGCSLVVLAFSVDKYRNFIKKYWYVILMAFIVAGTGAYMFKKNSADGRMFMNKISLQAMLGNGLTGSGLGTYTGVYGKQQYDYFAKQIQINDDGDIDISAVSEKERLTCDCPDRAFNEYLGMGVESGPIAMLLVVSVIVVSVVNLLRRKSPFAYGLITLAIFAIFSYPFDIPEFQIMLGVFLAFGGTVDGKGSTLGTAIGIVSIASLSLLFVNQSSLQRTRTWTEKKWAKTDYWYRQGHYDYVVEDGDTLMPQLMHDYRFLFAYGQSLNHEGFYAKSDSVLMLGTAISSDPMFWNMMGNNSFAQGRYREAEERYHHAFLMVPNRLYPLCLLAKLYHAEGDTAKFLNAAAMVNSFKAKVESANTERLRKEINDIINEETAAN